MYVCAFVGVCVACVRVAYVLRARRVVQRSSMWWCRGAKTASSPTGCLFSFVLGGGDGGSNGGGNGGGGGDGGGAGAGGDGGVISSLWLAV